MRMPSTNAVEVLSLSRTYVNLESEQIGCSLKDTTTFKKNLSGTGALVSIGLSRLGRHCSLISKIGCDQLGEYVKEILNFEKIDPTLLITDPHHSTLIGFNNASFYEHHSLLDLNEQDIDPAMIGHAKTLFLSSDLFCHEDSQRAARKAIIAAKDHQTKVILAFELWPSLGHSQPAKHILDTVLPFCNLIFGYEEEFQAFAETDNTFEALTHLRGLTNATIVIKCAKETYIFENAITDHWSTLSRYALFDAKQFATMNEHAAFMAGFIDTWLKGEPPANALKQAILCQQFAEALPRNLALPTQKMLQRKECFETKPAYFKHLQYATTRHVSAKPECLLIFGYHSQWQKVGESFGASDQMIHKLKALLAQSLFSLNTEQCHVGIITDEDPGNELISTPIPEHAFLARSIEISNEVPLKFSSNDLSYPLSTWPAKHIVKVSITYHPDDKYATRGEQEALLLSLYQSCKVTEHPLLIDITPPTNSLITASTLSHIMQRFYDLGIYPDWWQFASPRDQRSWDSVARTIEDNDPDCLGIFIQLPAASMDHLNVVVEQVAKQSICKGIVIGRHIVQPVLEQWLSQKIADHILIEQVKPHFQQIVNLWTSKKSSRVQEENVS